MFVAIDVATAAVVVGVRPTGEGWSAANEASGVADVPALKNLADCDALPRTGAVLLAEPIKTRGGSGGPVRVVALVPRR